MEFLHDTHFDFMKYRRYWIIFSLVMMIPGLVTIFLPRLLNLGIDFAGGTQINLRFAERPEIDRLRKLLEAEGLGASQIQRFGGSDSNEAIIKAPVDPRAPEGSRDRILRALDRAYNPGQDGRNDLNRIGADALTGLLIGADPDRVMPPGVPAARAPESARAHYGGIADGILAERRREGMFTSWDRVGRVGGVSPAAVQALQRSTHLGRYAVLGVENVGPQVGRELRRQGLLAVVLSLLGMLAYIGFRFEMRFGIGAVVASLHDVLVTLGLFVLMKFEFNLTTIAAFLTLVGYSVNDTVVIFDRMRENMRKSRRKPLIEVMNESINQTLSRTIMTSGLTFLTVLALLILGGDVLRGFAFVMTVGILVGTYSSIYIASPFALLWEHYFGASAKQRKLEAARGGEGRAAAPPAPTTPKTPQPEAPPRPVEAGLTGASRWASPPAATGSARPAPLPAFHRLDEIAALYLLLLWKPPPGAPGRAGGGPKVMASPSKSVPPPVVARQAVGFEDLVRSLEGHGRRVDTAFLSSVYSFSARMHQDQVRRSGEPFLIHPLNVAYILADLNFDQTCVAVGLLHDVLEDTLTTREVLEESFGPEITELVDGVTKIGRHEYVRRDEAQAETFRKMILASAKDIRVIVVKLADRLHNMQTLQHLSVDARRRISRETLEIYSPIAHRLGMSRVKGDLEDLAFYHLYPHQFAELHMKIAEKVKVGQGATEKIRDQLARSLESAGIDAEISFRTKRYYSIYSKLRRQGIDISQLYDYLAFRIVTGSLKDTYAALGVVHQNWRPIPGRFKDYIAMPKPNLYQSLHTTVVGERGQAFEVQIRTREMDLVAEEGIAAHWRYKEGKVEPSAGDPNILWLRQLLEWQKEVQDPRTFLTTLKIDLYPDEVYVFTPKGEVYSFPRGATPLDYAYKVHTQLGHHCAGARVNGKLVPLRTPLSNGDMVEILTNPNRNPSRDWLTFVRTSRAKSKIRQWLNTQQKQRAVEIGRRLLERELRRYHVNAKKFVEGPELARYLADEGIARPEDLWSRIGFGKADARAVLSRVLGDEKLAEPAEPGRLRQAVSAVSKILPFREGPIAVKGHGDLLAYLAKCCNPLPGEEIVGYVTRGKGVSVHSVDCPNVKNLMYNPEREIEVEWARSKDDVYQISLVIETEDQPGMLARLTEVIAKADSNITQIEAETHETGPARIGVICQLRDMKHLEKLMRSVRSIPGVLSVHRRMSGAETVAEVLN